jgi:hypothetical protein
MVAKGTKLPQAKILLKRSFITFAPHNIAL